MAALELVLDVAYHDGSERDLAVAAEAWTLAGYHDGSIDISHSSQEDTFKRVEAARRGRQKRILRSDARGLLAGIEALAKSGAITYSSCAEANRQRWLARGGHRLRNGVLP
jgi:L-alanine-DL-glutamate epimerase-like enolase superfamily enzyme